MLHPRPAAAAFLDRERDECCRKECVYGRGSFHRRRTGLFDFKHGIRLLYGESAKKKKIALHGNEGLIGSCIVVFLVRGTDGSDVRMCV